jgi:hypothetical protein
MAVPYNGTVMTGGDSLADDLNIYYDVRIYRSLSLRLP